jgi:prophage maintenance system killer protein
MMTPEIILYSTPDGVKVDVQLQGETIWLSLNQLAELFQRDKSVISRHLKNIFATQELDRNLTVAKNATVAEESGRKVSREIEHFNLDVIISVGYRVNSKQGTLFRQWASQVLKEHLLQGFTLNRNRVKDNYTQFIDAVAQVKKLLPAESIIDHQSVLELITLFADTWLSLDAYDRDQLPLIGSSKQQIEITADQLKSALRELRQALITKGEATELFGTERDQDHLSGIVGNVFQSFNNQELYPSIEEKAAHLLYFIIKNHPFIDGNKRSGAYAFIWLLRQAKILDITRMSPPALTALTLLIAESNPSDKDKMVGLVCHLLSK